MLNACIGLLPAIYLIGVSRYLKDGVPKMLTFAGGRGACERTQSCECQIAPLLWSPGAPAQAMHTILSTLTNYFACTSRAAAVLP